MGCTIKPDEIKRVKALGFLNNKGTDLFNARIITVNGKTVFIWPSTSSIKTPSAMSA